MYTDSTSYIHVFSTPHPNHTSGLFLFTFIQLQIPRLHHTPNMNTEPGTTSSPAVKLIRLGTMALQWVWMKWCPGFVS